MIVKSKITGYANPKKGSNQKSFGCTNGHKQENNKHTKQMKVNTFIIFESPKSLEIILAIFTLFE